MNSLQTYSAGVGFWLVALAYVISRWSTHVCNCMYIYTHIQSYICIYIYCSWFIVYCYLDTHGNMIFLFHPILHISWMGWNSQLIGCSGSLQLLLASLASRRKVEGGHVSKLLFGPWDTSQVGFPLLPRPFADFERGCFLLFIFLHYKYLKIWRIFFQVKFPLECKFLLSRVENKKIHEEGNLRESHLEEKTR